MIDSELSNVFKSMKDLSDKDELNFLLTYLMSNKDSLFTTLFSIFDLDDIYKLTLLYGGSSIDIPTADKFKTILNTFIAYYLIEIKKESWDEVHRKFPNIDRAREARLIYVIREKLKGANPESAKKLKGLLREIK